MRSNHNPQQEEKTRRPSARGSLAEFFTTPIDHDKKNALKDRELREFLKDSINFNKLVKAGILLSDGRIVCGDEQWNETKENILKKSNKPLSGIRAFVSPERRFFKGRGGQVKAGSFSADIGLRRGSIIRTGRSSSHPLLDNQSDTGSQNSDELWGSMSNIPGTSKERSQSRKGSARSRDHISRHSSQSFHRARGIRHVPGKASSVAAIKDDKSPDLKRQLREQDAINKHRIMEELRRDGERKESINNKHHRTKDHGRHSHRLHLAAEKIDNADDAVLKTLQKSREILKMIKDGDRVIKTLTHLSESERSSIDFDSLENIDAVFIELLRRQEKLFRALGERNADDVNTLLEAVPAALEKSHETMYKEYGPHVELRRLISDFNSENIGGDVFFKEAADLVKHMHPGRVVEYFGRHLISKTGPRKLLKVTSKTSSDENRFVLSWTSNRLSEESARLLASKVVDATLERAHSVHAYLTESSGANLNMLGIGNSDSLVALHKRINVGDLTIETHNDEHVSFNKRSVVCPRPLESGLAVSDLKPVLDRPPTPVPEMESRRKSRERTDEANISETKKNARQLLQDVRYESNKRLRKKMKQEGLKFNKSESQRELTPPPHVSRGLQDRVYAIFGEWKEEEKKRRAQLAKVADSVSDLVPRVEGVHRERLVKTLSRQVSSLVSATLKEARNILFEAMNKSAAIAEHQDKDNKLYHESVFSAITPGPSARRTEDYEDLTHDIVPSPSLSHHTSPAKKQTEQNNTQELSLDGSDQGLASENLDVTDSEIVPRFHRQRLQPAALPQEEERDSVPELPPASKSEHSPRAVASMPITRQRPDADVASGTGGSDMPPPKTQSLPPSRMMLRCDSDPRLSLRISAAEVMVDIHQHSATCQHHEARDEDQRELEKLESLAFGVNAERTLSADRMKAENGVATEVRLKRSGSVDSGPLTHPDLDNDDTSEFRVRHVADGETSQPAAQSGYY